MAFVNRSIRVIESAKNEDYVGPGKYLNQEDWEKREKSAAPFNTSSNRTALFNSNNSPGPGTYHPIIESTLAKNKRESQYTFADSTNDNIFISAEKRFRTEKADSIPGPGEYNLNASSPKQTKDKYLFGENKPKHLSLSNERVLSIPSKEKCFGYQVSSAGLVSLSQDPDQENKFSGEKGDSIAPNQYNLKEPFKRNNIIDWNRSGNGKIERNISSLPTIDNVNMSLRAIETTETVRVKKKKDKIPVICRNKRQGLKTTEDKGQIDFVLFREKKSSLPGPGAYSPYSYIDDKKFLPLPENFQNFGSSLSRSTVNKTKTEDNGIGPGNYFKEELLLAKKHSLRRSDIPKISLNLQGSESKFQKIKNDRDNFSHFIGPGSYEIDNSSFSKPKAVSSIDSFGSLEKRFIDIVSKERNSNPGAGSYISLIAWADPSKQQIGKSHPTEIRSGPKEYMPGVGQYYPEKLHSIEFNLHNKKYFKVHVAPFESNCRRFPNKPRLNINLGPGTYDLAKHSQSNKNKRTDLPFLSSEERSSFPFQEGNRHLGPGTYEVNSYFEWNKKSFNALFS